MASYTVAPNKHFIISKVYGTKKAKIAQNSSATADLKAGTLLAINASGKMVTPASVTVNCTVTGGTAGETVTFAEFNYPVCVLLNDIAKADLIAGDVSADVVVNAKVSKALIVEINSGLTINDQFIFNTLKNGIDIAAELV